MFCKYKNIFGEPNTGLHEYRILDIAIVDVILTIMVAFFINIYLPHYNVIVILIVLFLIGIISHRIFCVRTTIDKLLFQ